MPKGTPAAGNTDTQALALAECLANKKVTMYGAAWCPHCQAQKKEFGAAFEKVPYVECPDNPQLCLDKKVTGYPTWIFPDGTRLEGEQDLSVLAQKAGCGLSATSSATTSQQ